jgi:hypothetical protein
MSTFYLIVLLAVTLFVLLRLQRKATISPLLALSLLFCFGLWYLMPILLTLLFWGTDTDYGFQLKTLGLEYDAYVRVGLIETGAFLAVSILLLSLRQPFFRFLTDSRIARQRFRPRFIFAVLVIGFVTVLYVEFSTESLWGSDYLERNAFLMTADAETLGLSSVVGLLNQLITCLAYASLLTTWPKTHAARFIPWLSWGWVFYSVSTDLLTGGRIVLLAPIVLYIMRKRALGLWTRQHTVQIIGVAFVTIIVGAPLALLIGDIRGAGELNSENVQSEAADRPTTPIQEQAVDAVEELVLKFNSPLCGQMLLETGTGLGWQPFLGSLLAVVPRSLIPDKPVAGSMTSDYWGHPTRIVAALQGMETSGNVQVSPAAIAMWELAYPGLVLLVLFNLFSFYLLNSLLLSTSLLCRTLALYLIGAPAFYTLFSSPDNVIQLTERIAVVLVLAAVVQRVLSGPNMATLGHPVTTHTGAM